MKYRLYIFCLSLLLGLLSACEKVEVPDASQIKQDTPTGNKNNDDGNGNENGGGNPNTGDGNDTDPDNPGTSGDGFYHGYNTLQAYLDHFGNYADQPIPFADMLEGGCLWHDFIELDEYSALGSIAGCWIRGYIVGSIGGTTMNSMHWGTEDAVETSIALAETPDCDDISRCVPVQLSKGTSYVAVRNALNLASNPDMLGQKVCVKGTITKYMRVVGLKNVNKYVICDEDE